MAAGRDSQGGAAGGGMRCTFVLHEMSCRFQLSSDDDNNGVRKNKKLFLSMLNMRRGGLLSKC